GSGSLLLGAAQGFIAASSAGRGPDCPRLYAIQAAGCAPLADAFAHGLADIDQNRQWTSTIAEGIATAWPLRSARLLQLVRESGGAVICVSDEEIRDGQETLGRIGLCIEPTAAAAVAGLRALRANGAVGVEELAVLSLTGSGQKTLAAKVLR